MGIPSAALAPAVLVAQVSTTAPGTAAADGGSWLETALWVALLAVMAAGAVALIALVTWRTHQKVVGRDAEAESVFEKELLESMGLVGAGSEGAGAPGEQGGPAEGALGEVPNSLQAAGEEAGMEVAVPPDALAASAGPAGAVPAAGDGRADAPPKDLDELVRRLTQLRIIGDLEGRVQMPIPPDGLIYRLRKGGTVLLLARVESDAFLAHHARRFDLVICLTSSGEVLTVSRLQNQLNDLMDGPGADASLAQMLMGRK